MPTIGDRLAGRYRLDALIGSGGFASVFRAHDLRLERDVAVKVLLANHATDPVIAARFEREARVLAAVSHPNVVAIHDVAAGDPATGTDPFLVMDLCDGGSLADRLAAAPRGKLPPDELVPILVDVAAGLDALHAQGIVHRDLKPSNVLLSEGRARIADLGIATTGPSELTAVGTTVGTLVYLAPEQLAGQAGSAASDVHALGVVAFLGLTGRLPRPAGSVTDVVAASILPVDPVSAVEPGLGSAFDPAISRALAVDPAQRPTAVEFGAALTTALERWRTEPLSMVAAADAPTETELPLPGGAPVPQAPGASPGRDGRLVAVVGTLAAVLLIGSAALLLFGRGGSTGAASPSVAGGSGVPASASASPAPSSTPSPSPVPSATPTATADPYANALAASHAMRTSIESAARSKGLNARQAKDLESRLDRFDRALDKQDPKMARDEAKKLATAVDDLSHQKGVDAKTAAGLRTAAVRVVEAANALPG